MFLIPKNQVKNMATSIQILLGLLNWLHLTATVMWFGGMSTNLLVVGPSVGASLDPPTAGKFMSAVMKKFRILVYICIVIILITGVLINYMMNPGFFDLATEWGMVTFIKHIIIAITVIAVLYAFEVLAPKVAKVAAQGPSPELARLQKVQMNVAKVGFVFALVILFLVGIQTAL